MRPKPISDILVLSPTPTHPLDFGNRKRIFQVCSGLKQRGCNIYFVYYPLESDWRNRCPAPALRAMRDIWTDVHVIPPSVEIHPAAKALDHKIDEWWDPVLEKFLKWYLSTRAFDAMLVNYVYLSKALLLRPKGCIGILDTHDRFSGRRDLLASIGITPEFFHTTESEERIGLERADLVLAIKPQEQKYFETLANKPTHTLPFSEPSRWLQPPTPDGLGYLRMGIIGGRNNINLSNVRRFLDKAIPTVRKYMAPVKFILAGSMCTDLAEFREQSRTTSCVELMGQVPDVAEFYRSVDAVLVPMDVSTGQKIKTGEALAFGVPLISHAHAHEGYPVMHRLHACTSFDQIAEACVDLSFDRSGLIDLTATTRRAWLAQAATADSTVDAVINEICGYKEHEVIIVNASRLSGEPYLVAHLLSMGHAISSFARLSFLFLGSLSANDSALFEEARPWARFFETDQSQREPVFEGLRPVSDLEAFLRRYHVSRAWIYDDCGLEELARRELPVVVVRAYSRSSAVSAWPRAFANSVKIGMIGINVPIPVPVAYHSFGGWKASIFGDHGIYGMEGVRFYTKLKTITSRWPTGIRSGAEFHFQARN